MKKELHIISTGKQSADELTSIASVIHPYIDALHLREKNKGAHELVCLVKKLVSAGIPLSKIFINDRVDVAFTTGVAGVQLGFSSLEVSTVKAMFPSLRVGSSVHSLEEAVEKEQQGADFLVYGHIYETASKPGVPPRGLESLTAITATVSIPVIAIGGITTENINDVIQTKVGGIALLSAVLLAPDPLMAVKEIRRFIK